MVAQSDLPRIAQLNGEYQQNARAIELMASKSRIISMAVARETEEGQPMGASWTINTTYMPAPENMIAQIRVLLQQRQEIIRQELHTLGVDITS